MKYGVCLEMFYTDRPFLDRIRLAAQAGYRYGEMWFTDATASATGRNGKDPKDSDQVRAVAQSVGMTITNVVIGSPDGSLGGGLTDPANRATWLKRVDATLAFCRAANVGAAIVCTGNLIPGRSPAEMRKSVLEGLKATAERAEAAGVDLFLEALNDKINHAGYFLTGSDEGAALCREVHSPRMKLLFDCYHMEIMEGDLTGHIRKNLDVIGHMHCAGHPGRHELWEGETNYPFLVRQIEAMGYQHVFAMEYGPTLESGESLRRTLAYLADGGKP
jgi:hydroxypyruvate isomerase